MEILNRGRGAGKSYALAQWQKQKPEKRYIVVRTEYDLEPFLILGVHPSKVTTYELAQKGGWPERIEVAFDDFGEYIKQHLVNKFGVDVFRSDDSTILVTTLAESDLLPGPTELPVNPDYAAKVYDYLNEKLPGAAALLGVVTPEDPEAGFTRGIWKDAKGNPVPAEEDPVEPQPVVKRMDELCIGDRIEGKGRVTALKLHENKHKEISATVVSSGFTGTLRLPVYRTVEISPKK